jgi:hypothetical protein
MVLLFAVVFISAASCRVTTVLLGDQADPGPVERAAANHSAGLPGLGRPSGPASSPNVDANDTKAVAGNTTDPGPFTAILAKAPFNTSVTGNASLMATMADRITASKFRAWLIRCAGWLWFAKLPSLRCSYSASKTAGEE